jgi:hypothetical protein
MSKRPGLALSPFLPARKRIEPFTSAIIFADTATRTRLQVGWSHRPRCLSAGGQAFHQGAQENYSTSAVVVDTAKVWAQIALAWALIFIDAWLAIVSFVLLVSAQQKMATRATALVVYRPGASLE